MNETGAKLLIFDLDGTLVDSFTDIAEAANHALRAVGGRERTVAEVRAMVGHGGRKLMADLLDPDADEAAVDAAYDLWRGYYAKHPTDFATLYDGVEEGLETLRRRGHLLAILSNKTHELVLQIAANLGLEARVDAVQGERPPIKKPDPAVLFALMDEFGAEASQTIMIGDGTADMQVATNAGVPALGVSYGVSTPERLGELGAERVFDTFAELCEFLA